MLTVCLHYHCPVFAAAIITIIMLNQGAYKFGKMKFPEFSRPSKLSFPDNYKVKPNVTNHLSSQFGSLPAELQNILFKSHSDWLHPLQSLCQPNQFLLLLLTIMHTTRCPRDRLRHEKTGSDKFSE